MTIGQLTTLLQSEYGLRNTSIEKPEAGIENNTYLIKFKKQKFVAKVYDNQDRADALANYQNTLHEAGVPVSAIVKTQTAELAASHNDQCIILCQFAQGEPIGWRKEFANMPGQLNRDIGQALAKMHIVGQGITNAKLTHALSAINRFDNLKGVRRAVIHGDLTRENVFVDPITSKLTAIIDFGDAHDDYITYDIATALTQIYITKSWGVDLDGIKGFLAAYGACNRLTQHERQTIVPLMLFRNKILLHEIEHQLMQERNNHEDLESILQSLQTKLRLLKEHSPQIKNSIEEEISLPHQLG